jgi:hypothetical protein
MQSPHSPDVVAERDRRVRIWRAATESGPIDRLSPERLRELRAFRGQRGIWVDVRETRKATHADIGATVGVLHLGGRYADDLGPDRIKYHYPETKSTGHDVMEVAATKMSHRLELPVFVITPGLTGRFRWLRRAVVASWDDSNKIFELRFTR